MDNEDSIDSRTRWSDHWPGVRNPTGWEVHHANDKPAANFLSSFQAALLHDEEIVEDEANEALLQQLQGHQQALQSASETISPYTYPLSCLLNIPELDVIAEEDVARLQSTFLTKSHMHSLLGTWLEPSKLSKPNYLRFACACLGAAWSKKPSDELLAAKLFSEGVPLWIVTMEMDNREARKLESVLGAALFCTYGMLSDDRHVWRVIMSLLYSLSDVSQIFYPFTLC